MPRKINNLTNMIIKEVSLVTDPASPGAVVLFTKRRGAADVMLKDVTDEPRDARGRWTRAAVAATGSVTGAIRQMAQALSDRAKAAAHATLGHAVSAVRTTRPRGAYPVAGGGVQFDFEHTLAGKTDKEGKEIEPGATYYTSVQIRPEHLRSAAPKAYGVPIPGYISEGTDELSQAAIAATDATDAASRAALREHSHGVAYRALGRVEQLLRNAGHSEQPAFNRSAYKPGTTEPGGRGFSSFFRAHRVDSVAPPAPPAAAAPTGQSYGQSYGQQQAARVLPALSTEGAGGVTGSGPLGIPTFQPNAVPPTWSTDAQKLNPEGKGKHTPNNHPVPLPGNHTAQTAGGWAHNYRGNFVPAGSPHVQAHIEAVHDWLTGGSEQQQGEKRDLVQRMMATPSSSNGKAFFTAEGGYVPAGNFDLQRRYASRYATEADRIETSRADAGLARQSQHKPADLFHDEQGRPITEGGGQHLIDEGGGRTSPRFPSSADVDPARITYVAPDPELSREHTGIAFGREPKPVVGMGKMFKHSRRSKFDAAALDRVQTIVKFKIRRRAS